MLGDVVIPNARDLAAPFAAMLTLAACADPMKYAEPLDTLSSATAQMATVVSTAVSPFEDSPDARRRACLTAALVSGAQLDESLIDPSSGQCAEAWAKASAGMRIADQDAMLRDAAVESLTAYVASLQAFARSR